MTAAPSPYAVLGLPETAPPDALRRAHRRLALRYHPDRNPGDPAARERFLAVQQAYEAVAPLDPDAGYDAERVAAEMQRAAEEAARRRRGPADLGRAWQHVRVPLTPPRPSLREALGSPLALAAAGLAVAALGAGLSGAAPLWLAAVPLVAAATVVARTAAPAADADWAVETHWQGLRDLRSDVLVGWSEIRSVAERPGAVDLALRPAAADRLGRALPADAFAAPDVLRLPVEDPARLAGIVRKMREG